MASIGTGKFKNEPTFGKNIKEILILLERSIAESEKQWVDLVSENKNLVDVNAFRINKLFDNKIGLDAKDNKSFELLKKTVHEFKTERPVIDLVCKSISCLFYLSDLQLSSIITNLPNEIIAQLKDSTVPFAYRLENSSLKKCSNSKKTLFIIKSSNRISLLYSISTCQH